MSGHRSVCCCCFFFVNSWFSNSGRLPYFFCSTVVKVQWRINTKTPWIFQKYWPLFVLSCSQYYMGSHSGIFVVPSGFLNVCNLIKSVLKKPPWQGQIAFCHHQSNLIDSQVLTQPSLDWCTCCENITEPCNCKTHQMVSIPAFLQHLPQHLSAPKIKGDIWHVWVWKREGICLCD